MDGLGSIFLRISDFVALSHERRFEDAAYLWIVINDQESSSTQFVDLLAESECLPLEFLAPMIDDSEYAFKDAMTAVRERIGGERFAKNGQIMVITE